MACLVVDSSSAVLVILRFRVPPISGGSVDVQQCGPDLQLGSSSRCNIPAVMLPRYDPVESARTVVDEKCNLRWRMESFEEPRVGEGSLAPRASTLLRAAQRGDYEVLSSLLHSFYRCGQSWLVNSLRVHGSCEY